MMNAILRLVACGAAWLAGMVAVANAQAAGGDGEGPLYVGRYDAIGKRAHVKLWLARYTDPGLLASSDIAFAYALTAYCSAAQKPNQSAFYTDAFAVARMDGAGYVVSKLEQLHKIDACKSPATDMAVLTKRPLSDLASAMVINWQAEQSVGGLSLTEPMRSPGTPYQFNSSGIPTAFIRDLDAKLLLAYAPDLARRGVEISLSTSAWYPPADTSVPAMATMAAISRSVAPVIAAPSPPAASKEPSQQAASAKKKYCLRALPGAADKLGDCFDGVGDIAKRISALPESDFSKVAASRMKSVVSSKQTSAPTYPNSLEPRRYVLELN